MKIVYSANYETEERGVKVIDPKDFNVPDKAAKEVFYDGKNLNIIYGYEAMNIKVQPISALSKPTKTKARKGV